MQIEGDRPQGPYLLANGAHAGHLSRVSSTTSFPLSGKYVLTELSFIGHGI